MKRIYFALALGSFNQVVTFSKVSLIWLSPATANILYDVLPREAMLLSMVESTLLGRKGWRGMRSRRVLEQYNDDVLKALICCYWYERYFDSVETSTRICLNFKITLETGFRGLEGKEISGIGIGSII